MDAFPCASAFWITNSAYLYSLNDDGFLQFLWRKYHDDMTMTTKMRMTRTMTGPLDRPALLPSCRTQIHARCVASHSKHPMGRSAAVIFRTLTTRRAPDGTRTTVSATGPRLTGQTSAVSSSIRRQTRRWSRRCSMYFIRSRTGRLSRQYGTGRKIIRRFLEIGAIELYLLTNYTRQYPMYI